MNKKINYKKLAESCDGLSLVHNTDWEKILRNQDAINHIREYLEVIKDEPDHWIKLSRVYHDLRRELGDE